MRTLIVMFMLTLHAMGQRELWRWEPVATAPEDFHATAIHCAAADTSGGAAVVIGEIFRETGGVNQQRYRLLWISNKGQIVHEVNLARPQEELAALLAAKPTPWKVMAISSTAWAVTDGKVVWSAAVKGKKKTDAELPMADGVDVFEAGSLPAFEGWFERSTTQVGAYIAPDGAEVRMLSLDRLALRSIK